jgi:hypothetical protein
MSKQNASSYVYERVCQHGEILNCLRFAVRLFTLELDAK